MTKRKSPPKYQGEYPTVNLPYVMRQKNKVGPRGSGSCVHATMVTLLRWQGKPKLADWWWKHNGDGEWSGGLAAKFDAAGIKFAYTEGRGDVGFLEWACRTRRGCGIEWMGGAHMLALVHFDKTRAGILDNNYTEKIQWFPRQTVLNEWLSAGSWAVTPIYTPSPPLPRK